MPVYFIFNERSKAVKIGFSKNVNKRLKVLQTSSCGDLRILRNIDAGKKHEKRFHEYYSGLKLSGEWFEFDPSMNHISIDDLPDQIIPNRPGDSGGIDWGGFIDDLGMTEAEIARRLQALGVLTSQATINRIKQGRIQSPRWDVGDALIELHKTITNGES